MLGPRLLTLLPALLGTPLAKVDRANCFELGSFEWPGLTFYLVKVWNPLLRLTYPEVFFCPF